MIFVKIPKNLYKKSKFFGCSTTQELRERYKTAPLQVGVMFVNNPKNLYKKTYFFWGFHNTGNEREVENSTAAAPL